MVAKTLTKVGRMHKKANLEGGVANIEGRHLLEGALAHYGGRYIKRGRHMWIEGATKLEKALDLEEGVYIWRGV